MISHRSLSKSFTKNFTPDHNSNLFPLLTILSTLFFKAVQFAGSPSQLSETLKSIWHSLRCCRKRGAICQQNSHASKNLASLLITSQIFCLFSLCWLSPNIFQDCPICGESFSTVWNSEKCTKTLEGTRQYFLFCPDLSKYWKDLSMDWKDLSEYWEKRNGNVSRLKMCVRKLKRLVKRLKIFVKSLKRFVKRFVKISSLTSTLMLKKCWPWCWCFQGGADVSTGTTSWHRKPPPLLNLPTLTLPYSDQPTTRKIPTCVQIGTMQIQIQIQIQITKQNQKIEAFTASPHSLHYKLPTSCKNKNSVQAKYKYKYKLNTTESNKNKNICNLGVARGQHQIWPPVLSTCREFIISSSKLYTKMIPSLSIFSQWQESFWFLVFYESYDVDQELSRQAAANLRFLP